MRKIKFMKTNILWGILLLTVSLLSAVVAKIVLHQHRNLSW